MNLALWIVAGLLAAAYFIGGGVKMFMSKDKFASMTSNSQWAEEFTSGAFKALGVVEALGAVGLVLPAVLGIAPILVPIAASALALYMSGAMATRLRRGEYAVMMGDFVFLALCAFVAWGRFGPEPFTR
ncbi:DoxX family protein [Pendulispora rubella]|uniref:DoxX family protein n=1 Tax=Pendulispora rubella TaxID=2741070 RepID=A0ABZ2KXA6_9BACT